MVFITAPTRLVFAAEFCGARGCNGAPVVSFYSGVHLCYKCRKTLGCSRMARLGGVELPSSMFCSVIHPIH